MIMKRHVKLNTVGLSPVIIYFFPFKKEAIVFLLKILTFFSFISMKNNITRGFSWANTLIQILRTLNIKFDLSASKKMQAFFSNYKLKVDTYKVIKTKMGPIRLKNPMMHFSWNSEINRRKNFLI